VNEPERAILPVLPLKLAVLYPKLLMPLIVGRPNSLAAVEAALGSEGKELLLVAQKDPSLDSATPEDLYEVGTCGVIKKMSRQPEGTLRLMVMGTQRIRVLGYEQREPFLRARFAPQPVDETRTTEAEALHRAVLELANRALVLSEPADLNEIQQVLSSSEDPLRLIYLLTSMLPLDTAREQAILEANSMEDALRLAHEYLRHEIDVLELRRKIANDAQTEMSKQQREYILRQQMRAIQSELGESEGDGTGMQDMRERLEKLDAPEEVKREALRELTRLEKIPTASPEHQVIRTYLEYVLELPWNSSTEDQLDIPRARRILDEDHFDLEEVKERILEQLGVLKLNPHAKAPILCFVGPPGTGKTSLGQSIARALGRKFERMSLGGLHDEAELRGHRRTYIGAMPGRLIQAMRRAGTNNPVLMLDEVDKLGRDFRGDPAAALLEVLDPEQNKSFRDNYLDLPFDLSKTVFITTANSLDTVPGPLLDRMETLRLSGYSQEEKVQIARKYLLPRQLEQTGISAEQMILPDETMQAIIAHYTREAGLRQLERQIGRLARKVALRIVEEHDRVAAEKGIAEGGSADGNGSKPAGGGVPAVQGNAKAVFVKPEELGDFLGPEPFTDEELRREIPPGVATGLAWTETGGEVLYIEATLLPGGRDLTLTGQLGEVMRESARAAQSYIWSHAKDLQLDPSLFRDQGLHVHVPAGAIPKDGPSAGIAMATAMASLYSGTPVRNDTAMTGEITLTGLVLPIGGVKIKVLAARRAGIRRIILPRGNRKDLRDLPTDVRAQMEFIFADRIEDVLAAALPPVGEKLREEAQSAAPKG
jgi:ATP-dependent Lon protease